MDKQERKYLIILAFISMVAFFSNLWVRPADLMEARNFITAREMIQNDNYIIPTLNDFLRFEKTMQYTLCIQKNNPLISENVPHVDNVL